MDRGVESRSVGRWAMRGQTGRRGLEAEAWGEGIQQILWNSIGGGRPQSGLDFQPSRPSWHSFQAQNVISVRGSGPRNKGGPDVTPVSVGTLPRTNGTWGAGDAPRLPPDCPSWDQDVFPIPLAMVFSTFNHALPMLDGECPCRCPAMEAQRSIFERASQAGAADWRRQPHPAGKAFFFRSLPSTGFPPWRA